MYVLLVPAESAKRRFWSPLCPRVNGVMMRVALVQVGDDLDCDLAPGVMEVGWVAAGWGAVEGYLQFDVKNSSRDKRVTPFFRTFSEIQPYGLWYGAPCACGTRSDSVYSRLKQETQPRYSVGIGQSWVFEWFRC